MSAGTLQDKHRAKMLHELGKSGALQGGAKAQAQGIGYRGGKQAVNPNATRPNMVNAPDTFAKWAQAALGTVLGVSVKIDGNMGPHTRDLIRRFQRSEGLTTHGFLDERTIQVLELRTGVRAPRGFAHEAVPHLLRAERPRIWQPKRDQDKVKKRQKSGAQTAEQAGATPDGSATAAFAGDAEAPTADKHAATPVIPGFQQDEAMGAVAAQAFDNDFSHLAADRLGREDWQAVQHEMQGWWTELQTLAAAAQPRWLRLASAEARVRDDRASSRVRRRWWSQHVDGETE